MRRERMCENRADSTTPPAYSNEPEFLALFADLANKAPDGVPLNPLFEAAVLKLITQSAQRQANATVREYRRNQGVLQNHANAAFAEQTFMMHYKQVCTGNRGQQTASAPCSLRSLARSSALTGTSKVWMDDNEHNLNRGD